MAHWNKEKKITTPESQIIYYWKFQLFLFCGVGQGTQDIVLR